MTSAEKFNYDTVADRYARRVDTAPYNAFYERPAMLGMLEDMGGVRGKRVLDAGCGTGWYAEQLLARGATVTGIDASREMLSYARRRFGLDRESANAGPNSLVLTEVDLSSTLPFQSDSFDIVVSPLVMHYIRDWSQTLSELHRVLVPGGRFLFSTHHPTHEAQRLQNDGFDVHYNEIQLVEEEWEDIGRMKFYRRSLMLITEALADAGFVMERMVEPLPTEQFRAVKPDSYARLLKRPEFLIVLARRDDNHPAD